MYNITRQDAADILNVSTRSIDRYVKSGKLRSKKIGKIIYIHEWDIASLGGKSPEVQEVIVSQDKKITSDPISQAPSPRESSGTLEKIYADLRSEIQKKDGIIQELSLQLWEAKEIAKNSISLIEFKKSQFLLEESKSFLSKEIDDVKEENEELQKKLQYEKSTNYILIAFVVILLISLGLIWFINI